MDGLSNRHLFTLQRKTWLADARAASRARHNSLKYSTRSVSLIFSTAGASLRLNSDRFGGFGIGSLTSSSSSLLTAHSSAKNFYCSVLGPAEYSATEFSEIYVASRSDDDCKGAEERTELPRDRRDRDFDRDDARSEA